MKLSQLYALAESIPDSGHAPTAEEYLAFLSSNGVQTSRLFQEVEMDLRFVQFMRMTTHPGNRVKGMPQLHSHPFYEIIYCRESGDAAYLVGSSRYRLEPGDIILIPPGVSHMPIIPEVMTSNYIRDILWVNPELMRAAPNPVQETPELLWRTPLLHAADIRWAQIGDLFALGVRENQERDIGWHNAIIGSTILIMSILRRISRDVPINLPKEEKTELVDRVLNYMESHMAEKISVGQIASSFHVSESTLSQTFRKKMGVSFYRCLTQRRLVAAKALIESGIPMENVGRLVGFADYSAFYRAFRQEYGISPRQYRNKGLLPSAKNSRL